MRLVNTLLLLVIIASLGACGGSGGGSDDPIVDENFTACVEEAMANHFSNSGLAGILSTPASYSEPNDISEIEYLNCTCRNIKK